MISKLGRKLYRSVQVKNSCEIGIGDIGVPRKGVGYFVCVSVDPFAGESGFATFRSVESALVHPVLDQMQEIWEIPFQKIDPWPDDRGEKL